jgi:3-oxoacyl-[acyl-carrier protein] reductase
MDLGIRGRVALVGGASSGLGRATADRLAAEGCRLCIWARSIEALERTADELRERHGTEVIAVAADATDPSAAETVAKHALHGYGVVDIVILNAGGPPTADPAQTTPDGWALAFQLLSVTPIQLASRLLPGMRERGWGRVVSILTSGVRQPIPELVYSNAARSALMAWLKTTARAVAGQGVTMNGVLPGRLSTPRIEFLDNERAKRTGQSLEAVRAEQTAAIPVGRYGNPAELASLVAYLCSEPAAYQTGTFTAVDGGLIAGLP